MNQNNTEILIPEFLFEYSDDLIKLRRDCVSIKAQPIEGLITQDPLNIKKSKFLGNPFFPLDREYPVDKNGKPMIMVVQLNFSEIPELQNFPVNGILQLYFPINDWWDMEDTKIIFHNPESLSKENMKDFSFIHESFYDEMPIGKIHELIFNESVSLGSSEDVQFDYKFNGLDYWDFEEQLNEVDKKQFHQYFSSNGHRIGGYADFTQGDPRDYEKSKRNDMQLLQIDIDDFIMFGDSGIAHIFISPEDLKNNELEKSYFYWDCC